MSCIVNAATHARLENGYWGDDFVAGFASVCKSKALSERGLHLGESHKNSGGLYLKFIKNISFIKRHVVCGTCVKSGISFTLYMRNHSVIHYYYLSFIYGNTGLTKPGIICEVHCMCAGIARRAAY